MIESDNPGQMRIHPHGGYLLVFVIVISVVLMGIAVAIVSVLSAKYAKTDTDASIAKVIYAAEAGVSDTLYQLNQNSSFGGYTTKKEFYNTVEKGKAEYTTTVAPGPSGTVIVTSTGYLSATPTSTTPFLNRSVKVVLTKGKTPITENVIAGAAGLTMSGVYMPWFGQPTAMQKGLVYSRGKIRLNGGATSIGSATDSARVTTPNVGCGTAANFPQQCPSNDPPLVFGSSWFTAGVGKIYGSVCATDQPASSNILTGPTGTGLQQCAAPDYGIPKFDRKAFVDSKPLTVPAITAQCTIPFFGPILPVIWPSNTQISGNVNIEGNFINDCTATIMGDVYIRGDLTIGSKGKLVVSDTLGTRKPVIVVTGKVTIKENSTGVFASDNNKTPVTIISLWSTNSNCSNNQHDCTSISSSELYNSSMLGVGPAWYSAGNRAITFESYYGNNTADISGLAAYSYFGSTLYSFGGNKSMRGIGGQEVVINPGGSFSFNGGSLSVTDTSPFANTLYRDKYVIGDYLQQF